MTQQPDYFANHEKARKFPWTLYHAPLERDLARFLADVHGTVLVVGCGLLHELDVAPPGVRFVVADVDPRAVEAVLARRDPRIIDGFTVAPETAIDSALPPGVLRAPAEPGLADGALVTVALGLAEAGRTAARRPSARTRGFIPQFCHGPRPGCRGIYNSQARAASANVLSRDWSSANPGYL